MESRFQKEEWVTAEKKQKPELEVVTHGGRGTCTAESTYSAKA